MLLTHDLSADPVVPLLSFILILYLSSVFAWRRRTRGRPLPPGPELLPLIGYYNAPKVKPWVAYRALCKLYGKKYALVYAC